MPFRAQCYIVAVRSVHSLSLFHFVNELKVLDCKPDKHETPKNFILFALMSEMSFAYHRLAMGELNSQHIMLLVDLIGTISWSKKIVAPSCRHAQCLFRYVKVRNIPPFSWIFRLIILLSTI